jgi:hypothetical protein
VSLSQPHPPSAADAAQVFAAAAPDEGGALPLVLASLWAALDARALGGLDRAAAHAGLLGALLDTLALARRAPHLGPSPLADEFAALGGALAARRLQVPPRAAGAALGAALDALGAEEAEGAVDALARGLAGDAGLLRAVAQGTRVGSPAHVRLRGMVDAAATRALDDAEKADGAAEKARILADALAAFADELFGDEASSNVRASAVWGMRRLRRLC